MGEVLNTLQQLQKIELKLAAIRRNLESRARKVTAQQRNAAEAEERLRQNLMATRQLTAKLDAATLEVAVKDEAISKHREALNKAKTNKEYAAILSAMNTEKADTAKNENDILVQMEEVQSLKNHGTAILEEKAKYLEGVAAAEAALKAYEKSCAEELGTLRASREKFAESIAPGTLSVFTRVAEHHDGEAMASVIKLHPKRNDWACSGCNMNVSLPIVDSLRIKDEIQICQFCGRILFVGK
jgi:predicted  nucleic acid-binding Zn-ribbon protein